MYFVFFCFFVKFKILREGGATCHSHEVDQ